MKDKYIKQVKKSLKVTGKAKKEIIRDIEEIFDSAVEHGESESEVIERLGNPEKLAEEYESRDFKNQYSKRRNWIKYGLLAASSVLCFAYSFLTKFRSFYYPPNAIGHADKSTDIYIVGENAFDTANAAIILGIVLLIVLIYIVRKNRK